MVRKDRTGAAKSTPNAEDLETLGAARLAEILVELIQAIEDAQEIARKVMTDMGLDADDRICASG